jgi:hypothetical protein
MARQSTAPPYWLNTGHSFSKNSWVIGSGILLNGLAKPENITKENN